MKKLLTIIAAGIAAMCATPAISAGSMHLMCVGGTVPVAINVNRYGDTTVFTGWTDGRLHSSRATWGKTTLTWEVMTEGQTFTFVLDTKTSFLTIRPPASLNQPDLQDPSCRVT